MDALEHFDCLQLDDYAPPDNEIQTVKGNWPAAIENGYGFFAFERNLPGRQLQAERISVRELQKAGTQSLMYCVAAVHCLFDMVFGLVVQR